MTSRARWRTVPEAMRRTFLFLTLLLTPGLVPPAAGAKTCSEPGVRWERATPAEVGMDAAKLKAAVDYAMSDNAIAFRIYRHGCLVAENASAPEGTKLQTQSWSMAKGISSVAFGRAWTLGLISPEDPVGSLVPQADAAHGAITLRNLLTMSAGNSQALAHDFNILMADRLQDALTIPLIHPPGEYYNYWQTGPPLVDIATQRAAGEDFQAFFQREVLTPIGIRPGTWKWDRDRAGHTLGFMGVFMRPDDYARFGDLMRRGGVWKGRRLLSARYVEEAVTPSKAFGCYAMFLWVHASKECDGRSGEGNFKGWDPGIFEFNGLNQQLVTIFPQTDVEMVRVGALPGTTPQLYAHTLAAVTDQPVPTPKEAPGPDKAKITPTVETPEAEVSGVVQPPLGPAGPARARAVLVDPVSARADVRRRVLVALTCPPRLPATQTSCAGTVRVDGGGRRAFDIAAGRTARIRVPLTTATARALTRARRMSLHVTATTTDATPAGTVADGTITAMRARSATT